MIASRLLASAALLVAPVAVHAAEPIAGRYVTQDGSSVVAIGPCGAQTCGRLATILKPRPGAPATDVNNPDAALRQRPILGLALLHGFTDAGKEWRGRVYDPRNGRTYKSTVSRNADGTLAVKGCVAFLCQTQTWKPYR